MAFEMTNMVVLGWTWTLAALLLLTPTWAHDHQGASETYHVSAGHLLVLKCSFAEDQSKVNWTRGDGDQSLQPGVEVQEGLLWFKPVQTGHSGTYTCHSGGHNEEYWIDFGLSVSSEECPDSVETRSLMSGVTGKVPCKQNGISSLNTTKHVRWMKGCEPLQRAGQPFSVDDRGQLWLPGVTEEDAGIYTCLIDVSVQGRNYTAARSMVVNITHDTVYVEPQVVYPQNNLVEVEIGSRVELKCLADCGYSEDSQTFVYWLVNSTYTDDYPELMESLEFVYEKRRVHALSTLSISKVHSDFLNVPFVCRIKNPAGRDEGLLWLQEADHSAYFTMALCLTLSLGVLVLAVSIVFFKVELVLAYREVIRHFTIQHVQDDKLYDAYVSCLHSDGMTSAEMSSFALQLLPEKLEKQHGYSLYISGRDDCPGEALHDAVASTLQRSCRLIIILSSKAKCNTASKPEEGLQLSDDPEHLCYEQRVGLYDALTQKELRVILVEIDGPIDYSHLPESLRYIRRKQGALQWKAPSKGKHRLSRLQSNRNFWKNLRYHMPPVPLGRTQTMV